MVKALHKEKFRRTTFCAVLLICAALALLSLFGCDRRAAVDLAWQKYPFTVRCEISCEERFGGTEKIEAVISVGAPYCGSIAFTSAGSLTGYTVTQDESGCSISYGEASIPLPDTAAADIRALLALFALKADHISEISVVKQNGVTVNSACFSVFDLSPDTDSGSADGTSDGSASPNGKKDRTQIGTVRVYVSAGSGIPLRLEADYLSGESLVINVHEYTRGD